MDQRTYTRNSLLATLMTGSGLIAASNLLSGKINVPNSTNVSLEQKVNESSQTFHNESETLNPVYEEQLRNVKDPLVNDKELSYRTTDFSQDSDQVLLARMLFGEARNCSDIEKIAVAYTAINRANDGKKWNGETLREVVLKPWQYSCFNANDPNKVKLMNPIDYDAKSFRECLEIAGNVLSGKYNDPTNGATHYFNPSVVKPKWSGRMQKIGAINTENGLSMHEFYKEN